MVPRRDLRAAGSPFSTAGAECPDERAGFPERGKEPSAHVEAVPPAAHLPRSLGAH